MNKKLQKLLRSPKQFFLDSKDLRPIFRRLGLVKDPERTGSTGKAGEAKESGFIADRGAGRNTPSPPLSLSTPGLFDLVGDNWLEAESRRPVAVLWGCPPWKRGFVSRYLRDYRTAYAQGRALWTAQKSVLDQHDPLSLIAWGMGEPPEVRVYAEERGIPIYRMADGFIQSAKPGNRDTPALSFILDRQGIYFDASRPSGLEQLLNEHDFKSEFRLMRATGPLLRVMRGLRVSQYNPGSLQSPADILGPKVRRRVLVIGQVKEDASVRHGLAEDWTDRRLIELARAENSSAELIYQPHPKVAQDLRSEPSTMQELQKLCRVLAEKVVPADLFREVDHVYTITSLSGLEALIHGLPVTVVGVPFYAGWGLTDDRVALLHRSRRLSLEELFCGAYLLYPRYLTDPEDPVTGCLAAMLRVTADRKQHVNRLISAKTIDSLAEQIAASDHWPVLLKHWPSGAKEGNDEKLLSLLPVRAIFARCNGDYYQRSMAYLLAGKLRETSAFETFLTQLRGSVRQQHFAALVTDLWRVAPSDALLSHRAWLAEKNSDVEKATQSLNRLPGNGAHTKDPNGDQPFPIPKYAEVLASAQFELRRKNFEEAYRLFNLLLLSGHVRGEVIAGIAEIARLRFDFASAAQLLKVYNHYDPAWNAGWGHLLEAQAQGLAGDALAALEALALACKINPQYVESIASIEDVLGRIIGDLPYADAMLAANEVDDSGSPIGRAKALIASERPADAERVLLDYTPTTTETSKYYLTLSRAYSFQGKLEDAKQLIVKLLPRYPAVPVYREGLRVSIIKSDYAWGQELLAEATARKLDVGDLYQRKIRFGVGDIKGAYTTWRNSVATEPLRAYCSNSYVKSLDLCKSVDDSGNVLVVAFGGVGDEIRFASLYREMRERCGSSKVTFTCDPRLYPLLRGFYTDLEFVPVGRIRNLGWLRDYNNFKQLPGSDLHHFFDNAGWALAKSADEVILTVEALGDVIEDHGSFKGTSYLRADPGKVAGWRTRLAGWAGRPLVGLSWRSRQANVSRNEHYLSAEELAPLFEVEGVQFVNLQYDECSEELAWLEARFPGRVIHFTDLDQYNDLDGVAALMSCLDLIIAPATTVVELAGALGRPTLLLSNSSELHWRKLPGAMTDVWHRSVTHVESEALGDKAALIRALAVLLSRRFPTSAENLISHG